MEEKPRLIDYRNKLLLAPMVRVGTLPMRLLALEYGADIVYSEEIIDLKLMKTNRVVNEVVQTVDFVSTKDNHPVYRTCKEDYPNVVQLGSANSVTALNAAQVVSRDVAAIDLNCGCPKHFSVHGGMGAALLSKPDTIRDILTTLIRNLPNQITCKIRLLDDLSKTLDLIRGIEKTGVSAIAIHGRHVHERPRDRAHWDDLANIVASTSALSIPVIVNGDVFSHQDIINVKQKTGASSVMLARGAIKNASIFRGDPLEPVTDVIKTYLRKAIDYDNAFYNTKFVVKEMLGFYSSPRDFEFVQTCTSMHDLCEHWGMAEHYAQTHLSQLSRTEYNPRKRPRLDRENDDEATPTVFGMESCTKDSKEYPTKNYNAESLQL